MKRGEAKRAGTGAGVGRRIAPPRFLLFLVVLVLAIPFALGLLGPEHWQLALLGAFDFAASCFLVAAFSLLKQGDADSIRQHAAENDANRLLLLIITVVVSAAILITIASLLTLEEERQPAAAIPLVVVSLAMAWLFANTVFAMHYAHIYYLPGPADDRKGLDFPQHGAPDYWDFLYFSFTLGMTFQTSDVTISGRHMRRIALLHSFTAFVFNIGILAFVINTLGGGGKSP